MTTITADVAVAPRRSFQEVWVISLGHALTYWYPATFYLLLPLIGKELGLSYSEIGSVLSCQYFAGAIANIPGGIFVDTVGRKGLLMAASLFWIGFPYLMMGFSHAYWMILAAPRWSASATICGTRAPFHGSPTAFRSARAW